MHSLMNLTVIIVNLSTLCSYLCICGVFINL